MKRGQRLNCMKMGLLESRTSSAEIGQGLVAVLQIITAEELNLPLEKVRVLLSDTDLTPNGGPTTASRQTFMSGNAVRYAARVLRDGLIGEVAEKFDISPEEIEMRDGFIHANGHKRGIGRPCKGNEAKGNGFARQDIYMKLLKRDHWAKAAICILHFLLQCKPRKLKWIR